MKYIVASAILIAALLLPFVFTSTASAADMAASGAPAARAAEGATEAPPTLLDAFRCSISTSKFGCTTILFNCRFLRSCGSAGSGGIGGFGGETTTTMDKGSDGGGCTTNVAGKSCQDLIDLASGGGKGKGGTGGKGGEPGGVGLPGNASGPKVIGSYPKPGDVPVTKLPASGDTSAELTKSMKANQIAQTGHDSLGATEIAYKTGTPVVGTTATGGLYIKSVDVTATAQQFMPSWPGYAAADSCRRKVWDTMYKNLALHELGHLERAKQMTAILKKHIAAMPIATTQAELEAAWDKAYNAAIEEMAAIQKKYDDDTGKGALQGAFLNDTCGFVDTVSPTLLEKLKDLVG